MIMNTMLKYDFIADIYVPRIDTRNSQTVYVLYPENTQMPSKIVSNRQTITMYTKGPLEMASRVLQVKNPEGRMLFVEGLTGAVDGEEEYEVYVTAVLPVVDVFGTITGYRSTLRRLQPTLTNIKPLPEDDTTGTIG